MLPNGAWDVETKSTVDTLGLTGLKTVEETFEDLVSQMLEIEKAQK